MNTSYKIALAAAVVLCVLVIGYSILVPGGSTPDASQPDGESTGVEERLTTPGTPPRPLEMTDAAPVPAPTSPAAPPPAGGNAPGEDLMARVNRLAQATQSTSPPQDPAPTAEQPAPTPPAAAEAAMIPVEVDAPIAAANQPGDAVAKADDLRPELPPELPPERRTTTPSTITFGGPTPPVLTTSRATTPPPTPASTTPAPAGSTPGATYTIKSGDNFTTIAIDRYGDQSRWVDIAQANPLVDPRKLKVGQVIRLPSEADLRAAAAAPPPPTGKGTTYIVRDGDTLTSIAERFYGDRNLWDVIHAANREAIGPSPDHIAAGDKLIIPPKP